MMNPIEPEKRKQSEFFYKEGRNAGKVEQPVSSILGFLIVIPILVLFAASPLRAEVRVVATLPVLGDLAKQIGGSHVSVQSLAKGTEDPHYVIPRPSLIAAVSRADLFVESGLQFELWTERLLESAGNDNVNPGRIGHVYASEGARVLEIPGHLTRAEGDIHPDGNPHVWLNPENGAILAGNILAGLKRVDPSHAAEYDLNFESFKKRLDEKISGWRRMAGPLKGLKIVTYHREWSYFADLFGVDVRATIEEKPGIPPSAAHRDRVLSLMKRENVRLIVLAPFEVQRITDQMAKMSGARAIVIPANVNGVPSARDYFSLFDTILGDLVKAVSEEKK